jgi:hypothetical protein
VSVATLVIHGNEDSLINISGGRATRDAIRDAEWLAIPTTTATTEWTAWATTCPRRCMT